MSPPGPRRSRSRRFAGHLDLILVKSTTSTGYAAAGNTIPYSYLVTQHRQPHLSTSAVSDTDRQRQLPGLDARPGASETCTGTYTVTQADVDAGSVTNTATAHAKAPPSSIDLLRAFLGDGGSFGGHL